MNDHGVVWFRKDLRLIDNPAWDTAVGACRRVTALFVVDPAVMDLAGPHRRTQLAAHLRALDEDLQALGGRLRLRSGDPATVVPQVMEEAGADALYANADAAPGSRRRDQRVFRALDSLAARTHGDQPVPFHTFWGTLVVPPRSVTTANGDVSQVFTPFYKRWRDTPWDPWVDQRTDPDRSVAEVTRPPASAAWGTGTTTTLGDLPGSGDDPHHSGGSRAALGRLDAAVQHAARYSDERDRPDLASTSELSVDLHFGTLSPRRAAVALRDVPGGAAIVRQLAWRDWYAHLLWEHPRLTRHPMRPAYEALQWQNDNEEFEAWCAGTTGYPIVDAGMRQLAATGWMHNRVRMVVASFLVKNLRLPWQHGARWFWDTLVDADLASNTLGWQWTAGCGADAAPYFRVFNPVSQGTRFDADAAYVRRWVPELARLEAPAIHAPWEADAATLRAAGVVLGRDYPLPVVDLKASREAALAAYQRMRGGAPAQA